MHFESLPVIFFLLLFVHCLGDFSLQNDFIANAKNHKSQLGRGGNIWTIVLPAHGMIHAGLVFLVTGSLVLALIEFVLHTLIDFLKCDGRFGIKYGFQIDQLLHVLCKVAYVLYLGGLVKVS